MISGDLLDRLSASDRLHGDPGLELGAIGAALAHVVGAPFRGGTPPHKLRMVWITLKLLAAGIETHVPVFTAISR